MARSPSSPLWPVTELSKAYEPTESTLSISTNLSRPDDLTQVSYDLIDHKPPNKDGVAWYSDNADNELLWVDQTMYDNPDINCGRSYRPGEVHAKVTAGQTIDLTWYGWGLNHRGAIMDYMAKCDGPCSKADRKSLKWFKIQQKGLIQPKVSPNPGVSEVPAIGIWATDEMCKTASSVTPQPDSPPDRQVAMAPHWFIKIPSTIVDSFYVVRTELLILYVNLGQNQHYPRCINIEVTGGGSDNPAGVIGTKLYDMSQPGLAVRGYEGLANYTLPGPPLYQGGQAGDSQPQKSLAVSSSSSSPSSSTAAPYGVSSSGTSSAVSDASLPAGTGSSGLSHGGASSMRTSEIASSTGSGSSQTPAGTIGIASPTGASSSQVAAGTNSADICSGASTETVVETVTVTKVLFSQKKESSDNQLC